MEIINIFKTVVKKILFLFPTRNIIVFESVPDLADNTKPVFDELIKRGYNNKYKMIWSCIDTPQESFQKIKNVKYIDSRKNSFLNYYYTVCSKVIICCNRFVYANRKGQTSFYLMHGSLIKNVSSYYTCPNDIDYMITAGKEMNKISAIGFNYPLEKCIPLGYPRNDEMINANLDLSKYFGKFNKFIVWYPTVKQFKSGKLTGSIQPIPIIYNYYDARVLNEKAKELNVLIIVKPHFAQLTENINKISLTNVLFINDDFFKKNNITSYMFVGSCDALLTDYSSVYYDFLLKDRPIGLIWEDLDEYKKNPGVINEFDDLMRGGEQIYNCEDLRMFIERISKNIDLLYNERRDICTRVNYSSEANNTVRVTDYIVKKAGL